jgi:CBS domain-containing protein
MHPIKVRDVMTNLVVTLRPKDTIPQAAGQLLANRISGCPVVDQGKLVGVVTEVDLVAAWSPPARKGSPMGVIDPVALILHGKAPAHTHGTTIADIMTTDVVTVSADATVWEAARLIDRFGIRRLPVVDAEGYVIGIIARSDLIRAMALSGAEMGDRPLVSERN